MDISIILATYKRGESLAKTLVSFQEMETRGIRWEVHVVDNAGEVEAESVVRSFQDKIPISYWVEKRPGKNSALNLGISKASGQIFVFTDDDVIVPSNWLREIQSGVSRWPHNSVFGGKIIPLWPQGRKLEWNFPEAFYRPAFVVADWAFAEGPYDPGKVWGPCIIIRRSIFERGYHFDERIGPSGHGGYIIGDEIEFTKRLSQAGHPSVYLPGVCVRHQIRPEQLTKKWIYRRASILGMTEAYEENLTVKRFLGRGAPGYLYRLLFMSAMRWMKSFFLMDSNLSVNCGVRFWYLYGKFRYWTTQSRLSRSSDDDSSV